MYASICHLLVALVKTIKQDHNNKIFYLHTTKTQKELGHHEHNPKFYFLQIFYFMGGSLSLYNSQSSTGERL